MKGEREFNLMVFIKYVEDGKSPPQWLIDFMADGAREFLRGGKPWQNGKGGHPGANDKRTETAAFLLRTVCGLTRKQIVDVLKIGDEDGTDRSNFIRENEKRGRKNQGKGCDLEHAFIFGPIWNEWRDSLDALLQGDGFDFEDCPDCKKRLGEFRDKINRINEELDREPRYN